MSSCVDNLVCRPDGLFAEVHPSKLSKIASDLSVLRLTLSMLLSVISPL